MYYRDQRLYIYLTVMECTTETKDCTYIQQSGNVLQRPKIVHISISRGNVLQKPKIVHISNSHANVLQKPKIVHISNSHGMYYRD